MDKSEALNIARRYKDYILPKLGTEAKVFMFGSYAKGYARPESDIDIAVIVPELKNNWLQTSALLWKAVRSVDVLIEPILIIEGEHSPIYNDVLRTGISV